MFLTTKHKFWLYASMLAFCICILSVIQMGSSQTKKYFTARCIKVFDGRHLIVWVDNRWLKNRMKLRLTGIQCENRDLSQGNSAYQYLKSRISGEIIDIQLVHQRFWGWSDAVVSHNQSNLNHLMTEKGLCTSKGK